MIRLIFMGMPKALILIVFLLVCCRPGGLRAQDTIWYDAEWEPSSETVAEYYRVVTYGPDSNYVGLVRDYYRNGQLQFQGRIPERRYQGAYSGLCTWYYPNGKKQQECNYYREGSATHHGEHGYLRSWFPNGRLKTEGRYIYGRAFGAHKQWKSDGTLKEVTYYNDNMETPVSEFLDQNGVWQLAVHHNVNWQEGRNERYEYQDHYSTKKDSFKVVFHIKNGKLNGRYERYYKDGRLDISGNFRNNLYHGPFGDLSGEKLAHYQEFRNGIPHGVDRRWGEWQGSFPAPKAVHLAYYENGELLLQGSTGYIPMDSLERTRIGMKGKAIVVWYPNGQMASRNGIRMKAGEAVGGSATEWWPGGELKQKMWFGKNDTLYRMHYYPDGSPHKEERGIDRHTHVVNMWDQQGKQILREGTGVQLRWRSKDQLYYEQHYLSGKLHGRSLQYHANGEKAVLKHYRHGVEHGMWIMYDTSGVATQEIEMKDGHQNGKFVQRYANGNKSSEGIKVDNEFTGDMYEWYENGQMSNHWYYIRHEGQKLLNAWEEDGTQVVDNGHGIRYEYSTAPRPDHPAGEPWVKKKQTFRDGWLFEYITYHSPGKRADYRTMRNGKLYENSYYRRNGQLARRMLHTSDSTRLSTQYSEEGVLLREEEFVGGTMETQLYYWSDGSPHWVKESDGRHFRLMSYWEKPGGKQTISGGNGTYRDLNFNGDVLTEGPYVDGLKHGEWKVRSLVKNRFEVEVWENGKRVE